jgi:protein TonB
MNSLLHAFNISTLATWLSMTSFGTVGVLLPAWHSQPATTTPREMESIWVAPDITLGAEASSDSAPTSSENSLPETPEILPAPPELPPLADVAPLPDIPDLPPLPQPKFTPTTPQAASQQITAARKSNATTRTPIGNSRVNSTGANTNTPSDSSRLAAGRMAPPSYPIEARRKGQTGTVLIEFTVDSNGRVISAYAKSPSSWPLLNEEAVRTVRRWKFPPGGIMKLQRPIVFQLL